MNNQSIDLQQASLLDEILIAPAKETLTDRFSSNQVSEAACRGDCSGACSG